MKIDILTLLLSSILGTAGGYFGALSKWNVEKLKLRTNERILLIKQLREYISSNEFSEDEFRNSYLYSRFRKHLPEKLKERIDNKKGVIQLEVIIAGSRDGLQNELLDQICILEEKWKLI